MPMRDDRMAAELLRRGRLRDPGAERMPSLGQPLAIAPSDRETGDVADGISSRRSSKLSTSSFEERGTTP
jgi:hypothetical protein